MLYHGPVELRPGTRIDRYTLVEPLGKGGQGTVWKVVDQVDHALRALKLFELSTLPPTAADRANREAEAVQELERHPAIVPCRILFKLPNGLLGLIFDLVRGEALSTVLHDPRMTSAHRHAVLTHLASALAHVHARSIVHRDLKPANILVTDGFWDAPRTPGSVKLVDFGIAAPAGNPKRLTVEGRVVGTAPYLAPELLLPSRWTSPKEGFSRDIFAFGVVGWELFAGRHPTGLSLADDRASFAEAYRDADEGRLPWPPRGLEGPLAAVLARCLSLDPAARPVAGTELAALLDGQPSAFLPREPTSARVLTATTESHASPSAPSSLPRSTVSARTTPAETSAGVHIARAPASSAPSFEPFPRISAPPSIPQSSRRDRAFATQRAPGRGLSSRLFIAVAALVAVGSLAWSLSRSTPALEEASSAPVSWPPSTLDPLSGRDERGPLPCCESGSCKSGYPCSAGDCDARMPERWWRLRITGVAARTPADEAREDSFSEDLSRTHPRARVCVRRAGTGEPEVCSPISKAAATKDGDKVNRARLSTSDLERGGVEIRIEENGRELARARSGSVKGGYLITALCSGIKLYIGPKETAQMRVFGYLDEK